VTGPFGERDALDIDALITDRYLESLLAGRDRASEPGSDGTDRPPPEIAQAADRLSRDLLRLHPSFRFEEALAMRLADAAARMRLARVAGGEAIVVSLPAQDADTVMPLPDEADDAHPGFTRPLLIGGALTSAALSIAGAYIAWRLNRPAGGPMVRAVRAVARSRLA